MPCPSRMFLVRWRGGVRVLLQEVVLHLPGVVDAQLVGQLDLVQRVLEKLQFGPLAPGFGVLVFVEDPEAHRSGSRSVCEHVAGCGKV